MNKSGIIYKQIEKRFTDQIFKGLKNQRIHKRSEKACVYFAKFDMSG